LDGFHFASPEYLWVLLVVPAFLLFAAVLRYRRPRFTVTFTNVDVVTDVVARRRKRLPRRKLAVVLLTLALAALALALAQPVVRLPDPTRTTSVVLLVDVSESMRAQDVSPTRLQAAVRAMHDFVHAVPAGDRVGLVTFSDKVETLVDPSTDHASVDSRLDTLSPQGGTALGDGVEATVRLLVSTLEGEGIRRTPGQDLPAAIVLESDGAQNRGSVSPYQASQIAAAAGIPIYGVALGRQGAFITQGSGFYALKIPVPPSPATVGLLARGTGGQAYSATNAESLDAVYRHLGASIGHSSVPTRITSWFELAAAVFVVAGLWSARRYGGALP
jgi:Ca-activated chloride channel family protein